MAIRIPTQGILDSTNTSLGAGSVAGGFALPFNIPQDTNNVVLKMTASVVGGAVSTVFQTSDDGGTTFYDVARTSIVSLANTANAQWLSIPVVSPGLRTNVIPSSSAIGTIGNAAASTLGSNTTSGLPILGVQNRAFIIFTGSLTANDGVRVQVKINSQSATA